MSVSEELWTPGRMVGLPVAPETLALGNVLFRRYTASEYGRWHARQPLRYGDFAYDRTQMLTDLGPDIHPVGHMPYTAATFLVQTALESPSDWAPADIELGYATNMTHDIGECTHPDCGIVVGDIAQGRKTDEDRRSEAEVRKFLYSSICPDVPEAYRERMEAIIAHADTSLVHQGNESAHTTNTTLAGLQAGDVRFSLPVSDTSLRATQLQTMAKTVTAGAWEKMEEHARLFRLPALVLDATVSLYDRIQREF